MARSAVSARAHRPALDGLRAVAILMVLAFHAGVPLLPGGFLGVDVFFALSGYLITGLLLAERRASGTVCVRAFLRRRARRLLPELFLVLLVVLVVGAWLMPSDALGGLRADAVTAVLGVSNWRFLTAGSSYFDHFTAPSSLRHLWSVSVEQQFYLLFPLLFTSIVTVAKSRRRTTWVLLGAAVASATLMARLVRPGDPSRAYYGTDTRAFELLMGAMLAMIGPGAVARGSFFGRRPGLVGGLALAALLGGAAMVDDRTSWLFPGGLVLVCLLAGIVIADLEAHPRSGFARLLSWPPLVRLGVLSYGLYLWHWPALVWLAPTTTGWSPAVSSTVAVALSGFLAWASWHLVGRPLRLRGLTGVPQRWRRMVAWGVAPAMIAGIVLLTGAATTPRVLAAPGQELFGEGSADPDAFRVLIVGDSVGINLGAWPPSGTTPQVQVRVRSVLGCGTAAQSLAIDGSPVDPAGAASCGEVFDRWAADAAVFRPQVILWTLGPWDVFDHVIDGTVLTATGPDYRAYLRARLEKGLAQLPAEALVVIPNVPCYGMRAPAPGERNDARIRNDPARARSVNEALAAFVAAHPERVRMPDDAALLCPGGRYVDSLDGVVWRHDGVHFSEAGAQRLWRWLLPQLGTAAHPAPILTD